MRQVSTPVTPNAPDPPPEGLPVERVVAAQDGTAVIDLDDLERLARALKVRVVELFRPAGATPEERIVLALLEGIQGDT